MRVTKWRGFLILLLVIGLLFTLSGIAAAEGLGPAAPPAGEAGGLPLAPPQGGEPAGNTPEGTEPDNGAQGPQEGNTPPSSPDDPLLKQGVQEPQAAPANVSVTITVTNSAGKPLEGITINGGKQGGYLTFYGNTNLRGEVELSLPPATYFFEALHAGTSQRQNNIVVESDPVNVPFSTTEAKIEVLDGNDLPVPGATIRYKSGTYTYYLDGKEGRTDASGICVGELFGTDYPMEASYEGTSTAFTDVNITGTGVDKTFVATAVSFPNSGTVRYKGSDGWTYYVKKPSYPMFPGTYTFYFKGPDGKEISREITIGGNVYTADAVTVKLVDSKGNGLAGGTVSYYAAAKWTSNAATTDDNGQAIIMVSSSDPVITSIAMNYKGGRQQINQHSNLNPHYRFQTVSVQVTLISSTRSPLGGSASFSGTNSWQKFGDAGTANTSMEMLPMQYTFQVSYLGKPNQKTVDITKDTEIVFQTTLVTLRLLDSKGKILDGGTASFYAGDWQKFGPNGAPNASMEMLPATYSFAVSYKDGRQQMDGVDVGKNSTVTFQTGEVILHYKGGSLDFYTKDWHKYTGPVELLPVETIFDFGGKSGFPKKKITITPIAAQTYERTIAYLRLVDSQGKGIGGGEATYYDNKWLPLGTTDTEGILFAQLEGNKAKKLSFAMTLGGSRMQLSQDLGLDSHVKFQAKAVQVILKSSTDGDLKGTTQYYAGSWRTFGTGETGSSMQLLPGSYSFSVTYKGGRIQKTQDIGADPVVVFKTVPVELQLLDSEGDDLSGGTAQFYAGKWQNFGDNAEGAANATMEMLPTSYSFSVNYKGGIVQKTQDISKDSLVVFQTIPVELKLLDSAGNALSGGTAQYYAGKWQNFGNNAEGNANATMQMLQTSYSFSVTYLGGRQQLDKISVQPNVPVVFSTVPVKVVLRDSNNNELTGSASFYAGKWQSFGDGQTSSTKQVQLLPLEYTFAVTYNGKRMEKKENVLTRPVVEFSIQATQPTGGGGDSGGGVVIYYLGIAPNSRPPKSGESSSPLPWCLLSGASVVGLGIRKSI